MRRLNRSICLSLTMCVLDDGKGFVGIRAAMDTNYTWTEYGEMIGGWFDQHPWG
jgi:type 1 glutamine amidotransferase